MRLLNFIIGLGLALAFNLDSIHIVQRLSKDPKALQEIMELSQSLGGTNLDDIDKESFIKENIGVTSSTLYLTRSDGSLIGPDQKPFLAIIGWIITGFAISLGAGFWFDLLNKIVKLRSSIPLVAESNAKQSGAPKNNDYQG